MYLGTLGGFILNYDFRLNSIVESYKYNENTPIIGLSTYIPCKGKEYDLYSTNINANYNNYLLVWSATNDNEMGLWNLSTLNCDLLFKVNSLQGKDMKALTTEIPSLYKEELKEENEKNNIENIYKNLYRYCFNPKNVLINNINSEFYSHSNKRLAKLNNLFEITNTVQTAFSPMNNKIGDNTYTADNVPYIISAGNDMTIRYWDITKESLYSNNKKSYLINTPNKIDNCLFTTSNFDTTVILQSNETAHTKLPKKDIPAYSEYQNYNGISFHLGVQNEFDENLEVLKYCTKVSDASHKNIISDMTTINVANSGNCLLLSSSWDGTIKIWK